MSQKKINYAEIKSLPLLYRDLATMTRGIVEKEDFMAVHRILKDCKHDEIAPLESPVDPASHSMLTALMLCEAINADRNMVLAILLHSLCKAGLYDVEKVEAQWGNDIATLIRGLLKVSTLYGRHAAATDPDNFRKLLLTFAEDIRVILIKIVERLVLMKAINHHPDTELERMVACEAAYLYAPLAHRLGLYAIKSDLEDMSLKYTNREMYQRIARKLNETKQKRDAYIDAFINPVKKALEIEGLNFEIKGRTKSIYSIWNKMKKQNTDLDHIYDLFAIRIIIDTPVKRERSECWLAYSVVTDMYQPNPARLKDWLSIPKSNGYESLHITVHGPQDKWVEVQIRTRRMDEIAEKGIAAHWKYKGIKSENNLDDWMNHVREILETAEVGPTELMKNMKLDMYDKEVFVFTPKGDLYKLPLGATVLDFAFNIHSNLGCCCTGGRVNGRNCRLNHKLHSGDTVEILTASTQQPKPDWLNIVVTSKAKSKIRQTLKERENRASELGRELLQRRLKNRKVEIDEATMSKIIKRLGYKTVTAFYAEIADEKIDVSRILSEYESIENIGAESGVTRSAGDFTLQQAQDEDRDAAGNEVLVIGDNVKGLNYRMARCCNPIYGDDVFGFVSAEGVIKIHRSDCPNARNIKDRYPYRVISTRWSGKVGQQFPATLRIVGTDDIGIVTNITSIISKESSTTLRNISIDSHDGVFNGYLVIGVSNTEALESIIRKIKTVKGIKNVERTI